VRISSTIIINSRRKKLKEHMHPCIMLPRRRAFLLEIVEKAFCIRIV